MNATCLTGLTPEMVSSALNGLTPNKRIKPRHIEIARAFAETGSYTRTGERFGFSREAARIAVGRVVRYATGTLPPRKPRKRRVIPSERLMEVAVEYKPVPDVIAMGLSVRARNAAMRARLMTCADVLRAGEEGLRQIRFASMGERSIRELLAFATTHPDAVIGTKNEYYSARAAAPSQEESTQRGD